MQYQDIEQGSTSWLKIRAGKVTASRIADVTAKTKSGYGAGRKNYMAQLVVERLTGEVAESYTNAAMQWGIETEPYAREAYEIRTGEIVEQVGFIKIPDMMAGASPDGLVGEDGLLEIKCPNSATHIDTLLTQKIDRKYLLQMQWQMLATDRNWCDFVSYDPRMPENLRYFCKRVDRDQELLLEVTGEVTKFLKELDDKVCKLREMAA
jgi:putative phage-type endonuclease